MTDDRLSHVDPEGNARMVDVSGKPESHRVAVARGVVTMAPGTLALIRAGGAKKGDVLAVARVAGIMAAKRTGELIPLCHPLPLAQVSVDFRPGEACLELTASARTHGRTGVEMEALTALTVSALTVYDMIKAVDRGARITDIRLVHKSGGKSGSWDAPGLARHSAATDPVAAASAAPAAPDPEAPASGAVRP